MEHTHDHVILQNAINQSGLMDRYNHQQRKKKALVRSWLREGLSRV